MNAQLKITETATGKVIHHFFGSQMGVVGDHRFIQFCNTNRDKIHNYTVELYRDVEHKWFTCKIGWTRGGQYRGISWSRIPSYLGNPTPTPIPSNVVMMDHSTGEETPVSIPQNENLSHGERIYKIIHVRDIHNVKQGKPYTVLCDIRDQKSKALNRAFAFFNGKNMKDYYVLVSKPGRSEIMVGVPRPSGFGLKPLSDF